MVPTVGLCPPDPPAGVVSVGNTPVVPTVRLCPPGPATGVVSGVNIPVVPTVRLCRAALAASVSVGERQRKSRGDVTDVRSQAVLRS